MGNDKIVKCFYCKNRLNRDKDEYYVIAKYNGSLFDDVMRYICQNCWDKEDF